MKTKKLDGIKINALRLLADRGIRSFDHGETAICKKCARRYAQIAAMINKERELVFGVCEKCATTNRKDYSFNPVVRGSHGQK